jgi:hypothetical protein
MIPFELYLRELPDGRTVSVIPLTYGRARVTIGSGLTYDDQW